METGCFSETSVGFHPKKPFKLIYTLSTAIAKYNYNDQVKEDEIGRECNTNGKV
jgi:hypothetical protein